MTRRDRRRLAAHVPHSARALPEGKALGRAAFSRPRARAVRRVDRRGRRVWICTSAPSSASPSCRATPPCATPSSRRSRTKPPCSRTRSSPIARPSSSRWEKTDAWTETLRPRGRAAQDRARRSPLARGLRPAPRRRRRHARRAHRRPRPAHGARAHAPRAATTKRSERRRSTRSSARAACSSVSSPRA